MTSRAKSICDEFGTDKKYVMLYFSAHWCPPCRGFTPVLVEWYNSHKDDSGNECEIVFVSRDRTKSAYTSYYAEMTWASVEYDAPNNLRDKLMQDFGIQGIPSLLVLDAKSGKLLNDKARTDIANKKSPFPESEDEKKEEKEEEKEEDLIAKLCSDYGAGKKILNGLLFSSLVSSV